MPSVYTCIYLLFICSLLSDTNGQSCTTIDQCSCMLDDGGIIDISSLGSTDQTPTFRDFLAMDNYYYSYNPCHPFTEGACQGAAGCQISNDMQSQYLIAEASTATFGHDGINPHVLYTAPGEGGVGQRLLDVELQCDPGAAQPSFFSYGELGTQQYYYLVTSQCACKNGCASPNKPHHSNDTGGGLSGGSILLIIAVVVLTIYIGGGIGYLAGVKKAKGADVIPNLTFWQMLPGLIKEGFQFTFGRCISGRGKGFNSI